MQIAKMLSGANHYFQGVDILSKVGEEAKNAGWNKALVVGGRHAMDAAWDGVRQGLDDNGIAYFSDIFSGFNSAGDIDHYTLMLADQGCDGIIGIGGGKVMDLAKAVAAQAKCPVFNVATSAATCACFAPLSVVYSDQGTQVAFRFHQDEVDAVFVDLRIIANAPARYLAAGMADAMAKTCEYSSTHSELHFGDIDTAKYCGYRLAQTADDVLLKCGTQAYIDASNHEVTQALEDAVFASIAVIGVVSGMCGYTNKPGGRFAIAHGFNEIIRGRWEKDPRRFLHGEIVAVGILAQLRVNGMSQEYIDTVTNFFRSIKVPTTLRELGMDLSDEDLRRFQDEIIANTAIGAAFGDRIRAAIEAVR